LWPFEAPFLVIDLTPDYRFTTIGYPDRSLIWIMGRAPEVSDEDYARLLANAAAQGYDVSKIVRVPQRAGTAH
ncbi:MAG: lipocalin family protein, partial [Verrucomicrobiota bacterium]